MMLLTDPWGDIYYVRNGMIAMCSPKFGPMDGIPTDHRDVTMVNGSMITAADTPENMEQILNDLHKVLQP